MSHTVLNSYAVASADESSGAERVLHCTSCSFVILANDVDWDADPTPVLNCIICPGEPALVVPTYNGTDEQYEW